MAVFWVVLPVQQPRRQPSLILGDLCKSHVVDLRHVKEPYEHDKCSSAKFSGHVSHPYFPASLLESVVVATRCL
jgi:hypothetical protein